MASKRRNRERAGFVRVRDVAPSNANVPKPFKPNIDPATGATQTAPNTLKPGQALNISIPRGYFESRQQKTNDYATKYQTNAGRTTAKQWQDLADSTQKRMDKVAQNIGTDFDKTSAELDRLTAARNRYRKSADEASKVEAAEKYRSYTSKSDFDTKSAEGAKKENNAVQYVQDNWEKIAASGNVGPTVNNKAAKNAKLVYRNMTADEVKLYNYILAKDGEEDANKYLDSIMDTLNYREGRQQYLKLSSNNDKVGIQGVGETIATGLYGITAGGDQWKSGVEQMFSNELQPTSAQQYGSAMVQENLADTPGWNRAYQATVTVGNMLPSIILSQGIAGRAGMLGNAGTNVGKAALANVGKNVGATAMGLGASGNAYAQARQEGYSEEQARTYGVLVGASEALLERLLGGIGSFSGIDESKMMQKVLGFDRAYKRFLGSLAVRNASEISEELLQSALEPAFQAILFDEKYDAPTGEEIIDTILITLMSTTALGSASIAGDTVGRDAEGNVVATPGAIAKYAIKQVADKLTAPKQTKTTDNSTVSPAASAEAQQVNVASNAVAASNPGRTVIDAATSLIMEKQGLDLKTASKRAEIIGKLVAGEKVDNKTINRIEPTNPKTKAIFTELTGVTFPAEHGRIETTYNLYRSAHDVMLQKVEENNTPAPASLNVETAEPVMQEDLTAISEEAMAARPTLPAAEDVDTAELAELTGDLDEFGRPHRSFEKFKADMIAISPELEGAPDEIWKRLYTKYRNDGETLEFNGKRYTHQDFMAQEITDENGNPLTPEQKEQIWDGERQQQRTRDASKDTRSAPDKKTEKKKSKIPANLTGTQRAMVDKWGKVLKSYGLKVEWDDSLLEGEPGRRTGNKIQLNPRMLTTEDAVARIVAHEMVHGIKDGDVKKKMVDDIISVLHPESVSLDDKINQYVQMYQEHEDEIHRRALEAGNTDHKREVVTPEYAREEYAGDLMRRTFTDDSLRQKLARSRPGKVNEILNWIEKVASRFTGQDRDEVYQLRQRFVDALGTNKKADPDLDPDFAKAKFALTPPYRKGTASLNTFVESLSEEARETYDLFLNINQIGENNKAVIPVGSGKNVHDKAVNIASQYMLASEWNEHCAKRSDFATTAKLLADSLPEKIRKAANIREDGTIDETPFEKEFKMERAFIQRIVDSLPMETGKPEMVTDGRTIKLSDRNTIYFVGGEQYRRALVEERRALYKQGKLPTRSIAGMSKDEWGAMGFLATNTKTGASGDFTTICPQMYFNRGCFYCYRRAALETGINNKLTGETVWYTGEVLHLSETDIAELNKNGGLRIQSFGDWMDKFSSELADLLIDAEMVGLQVKIITKEPSMISTVALLKKQGLGDNLYFNLSADYTIEKAGDPNDKSFAPMNPERPFMRKDGHMMWKRAMTVEEAAQFRKKYDWVNTRIVATTVEEFIEGLRSPIVDVVTGYHGNIRQYERVSSATGETLVEMEAMGDAGMPRFSYDVTTNSWSLEYEGKTKTHKKLAQAIADAGIQYEYYTKSCCITGRCATCNGKCGKLAKDFYIKNATNRDQDSIAYWQEHMTSAEENNLILDPSRDVTTRVEEAPRYALETDEAGMELTPAQSKYFEKSKARDRWGNLMRFFHTTDDFGFTIFDPEASGDVHFFANSLPISRTYSSHKEAPLRPMIKGMDLSQFEELDRLLDADQAWDYLSKVSYENKSDAPATREELEAAWQESIDQFMDTYENTFNELKEIAERFSVNSVIALLNDAQEDFDRVRTGDEVYMRLGDLQNALRSMSAAKSEFFNDAQMWYDVDDAAYDEFISTIEMYDDWYTVVDHHANALEALDSGKDIYKVEYMFGLYGDVFLSDEMAVETALATNEEMRSGVYAAYLNVENPLVINCHGLNWNELDFEDLVDMDPYASWPEEGWTGSTTREVAAWAKEHGYDGVIFENLTDVGGMSPLRSDNDETTIAAVFRSEQVKSVFNKEPTKNPDIRYAIAGEGADNPVQQSTLNTAVQMLVNGATNEEIRQATGWWYGKDRRWRFEIDDSKAQIKWTRGTGTLEQFLDHPELFKNYPALKNTPVKVDLTGHSNGQVANGEIHLNRNLTGEEFKATLLHELQHVIQRYEQHEQGSNLDVAYRRAFLDAYDRIKNTREFKRLKKYESKVSAIETEILKQSTHTTEQSPAAQKMFDALYDVYAASVGETEARNTADRRNMTMQERAVVAPFMGDTGISTADHHYEHLDFRALHDQLGHNGVDSLYAPVYNKVRKKVYGPNVGEVDSLEREVSELRSDYGSIEDPERRAYRGRGADSVNTTQASEESGASFMPETRYALSDDVKRQYTQRYGTENPSDKTLMRHLERTEKKLADEEYERIAERTLAYLKQQDDKLAVQMYTKRKLRQQHQRDQANTDARVQKEREAKKQALKDAKTIADAEKAVQNDAWKMYHERNMRAQHQGDVAKQKELARKRLKLKDEKIAEIREANKERSKLRRNAARTALRDKRRVDAKRAEIEKKQGLVDTIRKMPAERTRVEKVQDAAQKLRVLGRTAYSNFVNMAAAIDRFAKRQISDVRASELVNMVGGAGATVEQIFKTALVNRAGDRITVNGKELGSMKDVFLCFDSKGKVSESMQALLQDYMLHAHNQDRMSFVPKAEAALSKFEAEHPYIAGLSKESYAKLVAQTDAETEKLSNGDMVKAAREYARLIRERDEAQNVPIFADKNGNAVTAEFSKQRCEELLAENPWLEEKAQGIYEWWDAFMRNWAVGDSISYEQYEAMRAKYPHYVPTYRQSETGIGAPVRVGPKSASPGKATQRATGSFREVVNIEDSFTKMVSKIVKLSRTNELYKNMLDTAMLDEDGSFEDMIVFNWDWQDGAYGRELKEGAFFNGDFDTHIDDNIGAEVTKVGDDYMLSAWYDGAKFSAYISEELFNSIAALSGNIDQGLNKLTQLGNVFTSPMKSMITGNNPIFGLRNVIRDLSTAMINTRVTNSMTGIAFYKYWAQAINEIRTGSDHWHNFVALGGTHSTYYNDAVKPSTALYKEKHLPGKIWEGFGKFNEVTESATRFAEYLATVERLGDTYENRIKGIKNAAEVTVDFSRKGRYGKLINAWVPYWNPAVQGIDKQIRALVEAPEGSTIVKQILKTGGRAMLNTVLLEATLRMVLKFLDRDDEWEELDDRTKDAYYCIPLKDEHKFLKIPKSREWSAILGNPFWRLLEYANGRDNPFENYLETSIEASYIPPAIFRLDREHGFTSDIVGLSIALDLARNEDFAGRTIIPSALQQGSLDQQFDEDTSFFAKKIGDLLNFSPMQIDYIIESYCGDFGQLFIEATADATWKGDRTIGDTLYSIAISPWIKDNRYSNYATSAYYDRLGELDKVVQDKKNQLGNDEAKKTKEYQVQQALKELYGNDISDLNKMARELPDGPEKDAVKEQLSQIIAEAIEYYDRAMAGEIKNPILDAEYVQLSDRVANELIDLDEYKEIYNFAPRDSAPTSYVDPADSDYEYKFTDEQKDKYMEIYYDLYNEMIAEEMNSSYYRNSTREERAGLLLDVKEDVSDLAKEEFFDWLEKQGVRSTLRPGR